EQAASADAARLELAHRQWIEAQREVRAAAFAEIERALAPEQEAVLRRAAEVAHKSLTDFILDSACLAAEQTLLDQRLFMVSGSQYQALMDLLDRPEKTNEGLRDLFARKAPWDTK
ncbi:MAG: DUF1778 domain-containing protein, partial [Azovibrio sp.]|nr:DUF1778 domain-containing protein [Azovibrio sp.]